MATAASWISKEAKRAGGEACVRATRIPVWALVVSRRLGASDHDLLEAYPSLSPADLQAAFEYATEHPIEIDNAIAENEAGEEGRVE